MKQVNTSVPRRPSQNAASLARSPKDAAVKLVRLEFDRSRLERGIALAEQRAAAYRAEASQIEVQRQSLLKILNE